MGNAINKCLDTGRVPLAWQSTYIIRIKTGDKKNAGTDAHVSIRLYDDEGESSPLMKLDVPMRDDFERGHVDEFRIRNHELSLGPIARIELNRDTSGITNANWFVDVIEVLDNRTKGNYIFPVHRWVEAKCPLFIQRLDAVLPQFDKYKELRDAELEAKKNVYEYGRAGEGLPVKVKNFPQDEEFSAEYKNDLTELQDNVKGSLLITKLLSGGGNFESIKELKEIYGRLEHIDRPKSMEHWSEDAWFGAQRVMSCNPVIIKLCTAIPDNFGVTDEMVEPFLEGMKLSAAMEAKKIYICDLKVMVGIDGLRGKVTQPIGLFYVNKAGDIMPIAIQLFQEKGEGNPVFLPSDDPNLWQLVKIWYNVGDSGLHQSLTHLAYTHLKAEGIAVCTHRNLSPSHPVFKILAPHFLYIMAINYRALNFLLAVGGPIDNLMAIGIPGFFKLLEKKQGDFRLNVEGHLINDLKERGVDDAEALPFYPYRDDAMLTWNALKKYVKNTLAIYYEDEKQMQEDSELQQWAKELSLSFEDGGIGLKGVPGEGKFEKREDLIETLTCTIFMCSVKHAAANFSQYDDYAFTPNFPMHLVTDPPTDKVPRTPEDVVKALPSKNDTLGVIAITKTLSLKGTKSLGDFEVKYLYDIRAQAVNVELMEDLVKASRVIGKRNKERKFTYDILDPAAVPNSISI
ncbi:allene oxide synthase-lipoxygenase protein-like [Lineus longissimus]|uniref:allene oxide synthase-lipoxygenase protein-like n=1 Tax=Lineus longissimus TaxID=88925 RepID=UPI00315C5831